MLDRRPRGVVVFVHGFNSSRKCWDGFLKLLNADNRVTSLYDFVTWEYPTSWINLNVLGRIPRLQELGRALGARLDSPDLHGRELTLVGHSQGGLVIQSWIADVLQRGKGSRLDNVRQAIFFATPSHGSTMAMSVRVLFSTILTNPQELTLRVLSPDVSDIRNVVRERVVAAKIDSPISWRVPIHAFSGLQDGIVLEDSAKGPCDSVTGVRGNHFTLIRPKSREDDSYREFTELLLDPGGHTQRCEIQKYETVLRVEPRCNEQITVKGTRLPPMVTYDNYATLERSVQFAARNCCENPFTIRYATQNNGYVVGHEAGPPNIAAPEDVGRWENTGLEYQYAFIPVPQHTFGLMVEIYKGYDQGQRTAHFHLKNHSRYRRLKYTLDLSRYLAAGYRISSEPCFYLHPEEHSHDDMCNSRPARDPLAPTTHETSGVWKWELEEIHQGIVDIVWDVAKSR